MPKVSVLMSCFDAALYVGEAIESILNQTYSDFEFIIINDGSKDQTPEIISSFQDSRIKIIHQVNLGIAKSLNKGIEIAEGKFIARMDADDICYPDRIANQVTFFQQNDDYVALGTNAQIIDKDGKFVYETNLASSWDEIQNKLPETPFIHPSVMFRKDAAVLMGGYPEIPISQDLFFFNLLANKGKFANLKVPLIKYRIHPGALSRKNKRTKKLVNKLLNQYLKSGELDSLKMQNLKESLNKGPDDSIYFYHRLLAKKYLWNNYHPSRARLHILKALQCKKDILGFLLYLATFAPKKIILFLYKRLKSF